MKSGQKITILVFSLLVLFFAKPVFADELGDQRSFFVDPGYDASGRSKIQAVMIKESSRLYFYVDQDWYGFANQAAVKEAINYANIEFENRIYPILTGVLGQEWGPGIDNDPKITVLIHPMKEEMGGYFRSNDEYDILQATDSNQREMLYISTGNISNTSLKNFLAHEFVHLISFNQKYKKYGVEEDIWLDEARAEYISTYLGYDSENFQTSVLKRRMQDFSEKPSGSLFDWQNSKYDYARVNLFTHYLVDHYGINILADSLHSQKVGLESLNYALQKNGFKDNLLQIFSNWIIAVLINDCNYGSNYCYLDKNLLDFNLFPSINFLPFSGSATLTVADNLKTWSANWYKIIGGSGGTLDFNFEGDASTTFKVPYIIKKQSGSYVVGYIVLDKNQKGKLLIPDFGKENNTLFVVPFLQSELQNSNRYSFSWSASVSRLQNDAEEIKRLLAIIEDLKKQIALKLQQNNSNQGTGQNYCTQINSVLSLGMQNNNEVRCLQVFLKNQGAGIYPEGLITGNFGQLTKAAVIKFQEAYRNEILLPIGLQNGTGLVGEKTRQKINQILSGT